MWQTPMSRLAKSFRLSDVGLRKICVKHNIPTPKLGYWAKLMLGKPVEKPPLPFAKDGTDSVQLVMRPGPVTSPDVARKLVMQFISECNIDPLHGMPWNKVSYSDKATSHVYHRPFPGWAARGRQPC